MSAVEAAAQAGDAPGWERGGLGQCLWHQLADDPGLLPAARSAIGLAITDGELDAAFRILVIAQYRASDSFAEINTALERHPELRTHELVAELAATVRVGGYVSVYY